VILAWQHEDWFAALKTGLMGVADDEIDRLENETLARGWEGTVWLKPITIPEDEGLTKWLGALSERILPPFYHLGLALATADDQPDGPALAAAIRRFWDELRIEQTISDEDPVQATVWNELNTLLENIELAFVDERVPVREWLPILEAGLA